MSDLLYFTGDKYNLDQYFAAEVKIAGLTVGLLFNLITPSEIANTILTIIGIPLKEDKMLQFINNLCLHELWKGCPREDYFSLALSAIMVYFEQLNHFVALKKLVLLMRAEWGMSVKSFYEAVRKCRLGLIANAKGLTSDAECISRFNFMLQYSFADLITYVLASSFEGNSEQADQSFSIEQDVQTI